MGRRPNHRWKLACMMPFIIFLQLLDNIGWRNWFLLWLIGPGLDWKNCLKGEMSSSLKEERCILSFNYKGSFCHPNFLSRLDTSFASDRWNKQSFCIKVCNKSHFWKHRILPMLMEWYIWRLGEGLSFHKNRNGKEATLILKW